MNWEACYPHTAHAWECEGRAQHWSTTGGCELLLPLQFDHRRRVIWSYSGLVHTASYLPSSLPCGLTWTYPLDTLSEHPGVEPGWPPLEGGVLSAELELYLVMDCTRLNANTLTCPWFWVVWTGSHTEFLNASMVVCDLHVDERFAGI